MSQGDPATEKVTGREGGPQPLTPFDVRVEEIRPLIKNRKIRELYESTISRVDARKVADLQEKYREEIVTRHRKSAFKYLDLPFFTWGHAYRVHELGLMDRPPMRILDIGSGGCTFLAVLETCGHTGLGIDCPKPELYGELAEVWGVKRVTEPIEFGKPIAPEVGRHDYITGLSVVLGTPSDGLESPERWLSFFNALSADHLNFPGDIYLELNVYAADGTSRLGQELFDQCAQAGAVTNSQRGRIHFHLREPLAFDVRAFADGAE